MPRLARVVVPGMPHHVTQRGNRRQQTFFNDQDYSAYLELMVELCQEEGVEIWGYCLMPNHTHLIAVPAAERGLRRAIGEAHRRYTRRINFREKWRGIAWAQPNRPAARGRVVLGSLGGSCRPRPEAAERRPAKKSVKPILCPPIGLDCPRRAGTGTHSKLTVTFPVNSAGKRVRLRRSGRPVWGLKYGLCGFTGDGWA